MPHFIDCWRILLAVDRCVIIFFSNIFPIFFLIANHPVIFAMTVQLHNKLGIMMISEVHDIQRFHFRTLISLPFMIYLFVNV